MSYNIASNCTVFILGLFSTAFRRVVLLPRRVALLPRRIAPVPAEVPFCPTVLSFSNAVFPFFICCISSPIPQSFVRASRRI